MVAANLEKAESNSLRSSPQNPIQILEAISRGSLQSRPPGSAANLNGTELENRVIARKPSKKVPPNPAKDTKSKGKRTKLVTECSAAERIEELRRQDREKKRRTRNASSALVQQLEEVLLKVGHGGGPRSLHETILAACTAVQGLTSGYMLRQGMLSQRGSGFILVDAESATVVEANEFILSRIRKPARAICGSPITSIFPFADEAAIVIRQLLNHCGADDIPARFVLGVHLPQVQCYSGGREDYLPAEFVRCFSSRNGRRALFMINVSPLLQPNDPSSYFIRALRSLAGFQPGEMSVSYTNAASPLAWTSSNQIRSKQLDTGRQVFHLAFEDAIRNGMAGNDFLPTAAPWALDFLLRGAISGDWGGLREWLLAQPSNLGPLQQRALALRAMEILAQNSQGALVEQNRDINWEQGGLETGLSTGVAVNGGVSNPTVPDIRLELRTEAGSALLRLLVRGLCLFEFRLDTRSFLPTLSLPTIAQSRFVGQPLPLEEIIIKQHCAGIQPLQQIRDDGSVWIHVKPSVDQLARLFGPGNVRLLYKNISLLLEPAHFEGRVGTPAVEGARVGFKFSKFFLKGGDVFVTVRKWVRIGADARRIPEAGGVEARNALLELYCAMRTSMSSGPRAAKGGGQLGPTLSSQSAAPLPSCTTQAAPFPVFPPSDGGGLLARISRVDPFADSARGASGSLANAAVETARQLSGLSALTPPAMTLPGLSEVRARPVASVPALASLCSDHGPPPASGAGLPTMLPHSSLPPMTSATAGAVANCSLPSPRPGGGNGPCNAIDAAPCADRHDAAAGKGDSSCRDPGAADAPPPQPSADACGGDANPPLLGDGFAAGLGGGEDDWDFLCATPWNDFYTSPYF